VTARPRTRTPPAGAEAVRQPGAVSIERFLDDLASASPAPGGGAAAALAGALAAALVAMVCRVTMGREPGAAELNGVVETADELRRRLTDLAAADARAYEAVIEARRLPADRKAAALDVALRRATEIPIDIAAAGSELLAVCDRLTQRARVSTLGDLRVAAALSRAALDGAAVIARINLRDAADATFRREADRRLALALADTEAECQRVADGIAERVGRSD